MTPQRLRQVAAAMMLTSAALIAFVVIPSVGADTFNLASPGDAIPVFWVIVFIDLFLAVAAFAASRVDNRASVVPSQWRRALSVLLGLLLIDAAAAYAGHGPGMRGAVVALWTCVGLGLAAGASMLVSTFRRSQGRPQAA
jgi:phosphatidylglycerophosphate synthase